MEKFNLIIPSAKLVSKDMQNLGEFPAALYPIESKTVLQRLYSQYSDDTDKIHVIAYENKEMFEEYLKRYKDLKKVNIITLKNLGDLGENIKYALQNLEERDLNKRIVINFGDTLVFEKLENLPNDGFYYSEDILSSTWTFFDEDVNGIKSIIDKKEQNNNSFDIKKLFVGVFSFSDGYYLKQCLQDVENDEKQMDTFYAAALKYNKKYPLKGFKTSSWCDIGHLDNYYNAQLGVKAREFNYISIDFDRGILKKTSDDKDKFVGEILWYVKLPKKLEYVRPRIFSYSIDYENPYINMEYYSYHTLHELFLYSDISKKQWNTIFNKIKFIYEDFSKYAVKGNSIQKSLKSVYLDKTIDRLNKLKNNEFFTKFFENEFSINGVNFLSLNDIINKLSSEVPIKLFNIDSFTIIHGDLCFSNILVDSNNSFVKLIDPRGNFGLFDIYGDPRYELAKLFHSIDGKYDYIIEEQFDLSVDNLAMNYNIKEKKRPYNLYQEFLNVFKDVVIKNRKEIEFIEALLFLSMIPLHNESLRQQCVMFCTGIEILNRCIDIYV